MAYASTFKIRLKDQNDFSQIREQGTHVDKIAAFSLLIRDSIIANIHEMDYLLNLVEKQKGSRDLVIRSMKALGELFLRYLLPDRKLLFFEDRSLAVILILKLKGSREVCFRPWMEVKLQNCMCCIGFWKMESREDLNVSSLL